jgi:hypothetical protein
MKSIFFGSVLLLVAAGAVAQRDTVHLEEVTIVRQQQRQLLLSGRMVTVLSDTLLHHCLRCFASAFLIRWQSLATRALRTAPEFFLP